MNNIVLHIPHASLKLPLNFYKNVLVNKKVVKKFNIDITDIYTDELFGVKGYTTIKAKYSRIFCDVEKFADDDKEEMAQFGMGFVYTHTNQGIQFLNPTKGYKDTIYKDYYVKYHNKLDAVVSDKLKTGKVILLDCHSFSKNIIMFEDKKDNIPDICIGVNQIYNNQTLVEHIKKYFKKLGYSVSLNYPYSGAIVPNKFFKCQNDGLVCVMIELNKKLYLNKDNSKSSNFNKLKEQINELLKTLVNFNL